VDIPIHVGLEITIVTTIVIPSLGGTHLTHCLDAVAVLDPAPTRTVVVLSGTQSRPAVPRNVSLITTGKRLGFATAVNTGIAETGAQGEDIAILNDDAVPSPGWLASLQNALDNDSSVASVQGTVTDSVGATIDGRGITLDPFGLPIQVDRGGSPAPEPPTPHRIVAVSGTASLLRAEALVDVALADGSIFDPAFGSYHEDLDLGLRLRRLGWKASWVPGAWVSHIGSATGLGLGWRHPWWVLANRWRALAGNLSPNALIRSLPTLLRGELRAVHTLTKANPRALPTAAMLLTCLPWLVTRSLSRPSPGPRLNRLPEAGL